MSRIPTSRRRDERFLRHLLFANGEELPLPSYLRRKLADLPDVRPGGLWCRHIDGEIRTYYRPPRQMAPREVLRVFRAYRRFCPKKRGLRSHRHER